MHPPMRIGVWEIGSAETLRLGRRPASSVKKLGVSRRGISRGPRGRHVDTERPAKARNHSWVAEATETGAMTHSNGNAYKPLSGEIELCPRVGRMGSNK